MLFHFHSSNRLWKDGIGRFLQFDLNQVGLGSLLVRAGTGMSISRWQSSWWGGSWWDGGMLSQYSYLIMRMSLGEDDEYNIECTKRTTSIASFMYLDDDCNIGEYKKYNSYCSTRHTRTFWRSCPTMRRTWRSTRRRCVFRRRGILEHIWWGDNQRGEVKEMFR